MSPSSPEQEDHHLDDEGDVTKSTTPLQDEESQALTQQLPRRHQRQDQAKDDHTGETLEMLSQSSGHDHHESTNRFPPWCYDMFWLVFCFGGIMASFVTYGVILEYATSGGRRLHELSFLFVTAVLGALTAITGRKIRGEVVSNIPTNRFFLLGAMSLGSTFCAIRALRYVIFPIQVLARSCKPVPVMLIGTLLGKKYPCRKYISVLFIVAGVALFMGGGNMLQQHGTEETSEDAATSLNDVVNATSWANATTSLDETITDSIDEIASMPPLHQQLWGILLLTTSLFFDGGTGAYEDKLMSQHHVEPFDLMFQFQWSKGTLACVILLLLGQFSDFVEMMQDGGIYILALGLCSAIGQVFIFITIAKFGALTCSLMSLTRKVTTLTASIIIYHHHLTVVQSVGLGVGLGAMALQFWKPASEQQQHAELLVATCEEEADHNELANTSEHGIMLVESESFNEEEANSHNDDVGELKENGILT